MLSEAQIARMDPYDPAMCDKSERESMETWLEFHRSTLLRKCAGLAPEQLVMRSCPPSQLSLIGLVRHMTEVESWFYDFDDSPSTAPYHTDEHRDAAFDLIDPATVEADLATFHSSLDRARAAVATFSLDDRCPCDSCDDPPTLRWVYQHMIEEYARHNGHADLIREAIDGATGM